MSSFLAIGFFLVLTVDPSVHRRIEDVRQSMRDGLKEDDGGRGKRGISCASSYLRTDLRITTADIPGTPTAENIPCIRES